jgi:hypothetical protein
MLAHWVLAIAFAVLTGLATTASADLLPPPPPGVIFRTFATAQDDSGPIQRGGFGVATAGAFGTFAGEKIPPRRLSLARESQTHQVSVLSGWSPTL